MDLYSQEIQEKEKDLQNQPQTIGNRNIYINNNCKCKWIKCTNHKIQTGGMDTKTRPIYMLSTKNLLQTSRHIQTESERMEKYIPHKWEAKGSWSSNPHIRQNRP